jgi:hypothetical protein
MVAHGRALILLLSGATASALLFATVPAAIAAPVANAECGIVKAAHWTAGGKSGNTWIVTAAPVPGCSFAKASAASLTKEKSELTSQIKVTPHGYVCTGTPIGALPLKIACIPATGKGGYDITATGYRP